MHTTKITIEYTVVTQFGPRDALSTVEYAFANHAAIVSAVMTAISSDWPGSTPHFPEDINAKALLDVPKVLK